MSSNHLVTRREALVAVGGAVGATAVAAGSASASNLRVGTVYGGADVHDACAGDKIGEVHNGFGDVVATCTDLDGNTWYDVEWDDASPDGWCMGGDVVPFK